MPNWSGGILTTRGQALQAKVDAGQTTLTFTKMKIGSGVLGSGQSLEDLTDLITPKQNIGISGISASGNVTTLTGVITNAGVTTGYQVRELGVFATDPTLGEILYSVTIDSAPDYLPPEGGAVVVSSEFNYNIAVSNAANVSATISTSGLVTVGMLQSHNHDGTGTNGPKLGSNALLDGAATDLAIGNRTITDTIAAAAGANTITNLFSMVGNMIKRITGKPTWYDPPATTLEAAKAHADAAAPHSGHAPNGFGVGTTAPDITNADLDSLYLCGKYKGRQLIHAPNGNTDYFYINVISYDNSHVIQVAYEMYKNAGGQLGREYERRNDGTGWSGWELQETAAGAQTKATQAKDDAIGWAMANTFVERGAIPANWNTAIALGSYVVIPEFPAGQTHDAPSALGLWGYGQLVVTRTDAGGGYSVNQVYYSNAGQMAMRSSFNGGVTWTAWKQVATTDQTTYIVASDFGTNYYWRKWSNGDIQQGGYYAGGAHAPTITFPVAFATACKVVVGNISNAGAANPIVLHPVSVTTNSFVGRQLNNNVGGTTDAFYWESEGR